jgi:hypothetical protein
VLRHRAATREGWQIDSLRIYLVDEVPTPQDVERLLIRSCVRCGVPIGNSQFASQWEIRSVHRWTRWRR